MWHFHIFAFCSLSGHSSSHLSSWCTAVVPSSRTGRLRAPLLPEPCRIWTWSLCGKLLHHHHPPGRPPRTPAGQSSKVTRDNNSYNIPKSFLSICSETIEPSEVSPVRPRLLSVLLPACLQTVDSSSQIAAWTGRCVQLLLRPAVPGPGPDHGTPVLWPPPLGWSPPESRPLEQRSRSLEQTLHHHPPPAGQRQRGRNMNINLLLKQLWGSTVKSDQFSGSISPPSAPIQQGVAHSRKPCCLRLLGGDKAHTQASQYKWQHRTGQRYSLNRSTERRAPSSSTKNINNFSPKAESWWAKTLSGLFIQKHWDRAWITSLYFGDKVIVCDVSLVNTWKTKITKSKILWYPSAVGRPSSSHAARHPDPLSSPSSSAAPPRWTSWRTKPTHLRIHAGGNTDFNKGHEFSMISVTVFLRFPETPLKSF